MNLNPASSDSCLRPATNKDIPRICDLLNDKSGLVLVHNVKVDGGDEVELLTIASGPFSYAFDKDGKTYTLQGNEARSGAFAKLRLVDKKNEDGTIAGVVQTCLGNGAWRNHYSGSLRLMIKKIHHE